MKFQTTIVSLLLAATVSAGGLAKRTIMIPRELQVRQTSDCPSGYVICGDGCIETDYTCCPDRNGGCGPTEECQLGDNGEYGCCDAGENCTGDGGTDTTLIDDDSSTTTTRGGAATTSSSRAATTTTSTDDDDDDSASSTTTSRSRTTTTAVATPASGDSGSGTGGNDTGAAGYTYGSLSSALVLAGSAAAAVMTLVAAIAL